MPIDRTPPTFTATTDATGATTAEYRDRTVHLTVSIPAGGGCAEASLERFDLMPQELPKLTPRTPRKASGGCGACRKAAERHKPATVILRGWRARLHRRAGRERVCAKCDLAQRHFGLEWCGSPRNIWRRLVGRLTDGCGCILNIKRRVGRAECPRDLWRHE